MNAVVNLLGSEPQTSVITRDDAEELLRSVIETGAGVALAARGVWRTVERLVAMRVHERLGISVGDLRDRVGGNIRLLAADRREAVKELEGKDYSISQTAEILGVGTKTVERDRRPPPPSNDGAADSAPDEESMTYEAAPPSNDGAGLCGRQVDLEEAIADSAGDEAPAIPGGQQELIHRPRETETEEISRVRRVALAKNLMNMRLLSQTLAGERHIEHVAKFLREHPDEFQSVSGMSVSDYLGTLKTIRAQADALIKKVKHRG